MFGPLLLYGTGGRHLHAPLLATVEAPGELVAVAYRDWCGGRSYDVPSAEGELGLAVDGDRTYPSSNGHDLAFVAVSVVEDAGTVHADADRRADGRAVGESASIKLVAAEEGATP